MKPIFNNSAATVAYFFLAAAFTSVQAAQISFTAGNPAVAADVNANFTELYNSKWTLTGSDLSYSAGKVGIGIATPARGLHISGSTASGLAEFVIENTDVASGTTGRRWRQIIANTGDLTFGALNGTMGGSINVMTMLPSGNVGIGTTVPGNLFTVKSNVASGIPMKVLNSSGNNAIAITVDPTGNQLVVGDNAGTATAVIASSGDSYVMNKFGVGNSVPGATLDVTGTIRGSSDITTTGGDLQVDKAAGTFRTVRFNTAGNSRWVLAADNVAEGGSNAGSRFVIRRYTDAGALIDEAMIINRSTGQAQFGTVANPANLVVYGTGTTCNIGNGTGGTSCTSDRALKENIRPLTKALQSIIGLSPVYYNMKRDVTKISRLGLIAQDVQAYFPELVSKSEETGMLSLDYAGLIAPTIAALKELKSEKDTQVLALEKRATQAEQRYAAGLRQTQSDREIAAREKAAADARIAALEKRLNSELMARQQQDIRLAKLEQALQRQVVARR